MSSCGMRKQIAQQEFLPLRKNPCAAHTHKTHKNTQNAYSDDLHPRQPILMRIHPSFLLGMFVMVVLTPGCAPVPSSMPLAEAKSSALSPDGSTRPVAPSSQQGMTVHIDPATGEFIAEPVPDEALEINPEMQNAMSTSSEGLSEEKSPIPGGGVGVNLQGRFQSPLIAHQDPNGSIKIRHLEKILPPAPESSSPAARGNNHAHE